MYDVSNLSVNLGQIYVLLPFRLSMSTPEILTKSIGVSRVRVSQDDHIVVSSYIGCASIFLAFIFRYTISPVSLLTLCFAFRYGHEIKTIIFVH